NTCRSRSLHGLGAGVCAHRRQSQSGQSGRGGDGHLSPRCGLANHAVANAAEPIERMAAGKMADVRPGPGAEPAVRPAEFLETTRRQKKVPDAVRVHLDPAFPYQADLVFPQAAVAPLAGRRNAGSLRFALDTNARRLSAGIPHALAPEGALFESAFAARGVDRVDVELAQ